VNQEKFLRRNAIFDALVEHGYTTQNLLPAFPGVLESEVVQRLEDNSLRYRRTVERFGYLGTRACTSRYFNVASAGYRRALSATNRKPELGQIHCYGGSTTAGHNVGDEETWPHHLEAVLSREFKTVQVMNFGAGNHTSTHASLCLLDHCLRGLVPRIAIMFTGLNDCIYAIDDPDGALSFLDKALFLSQHSPGMETTIGAIRELIPARGKSLHPGRTAAMARRSTQELIDIVRTRYRVSTGIQAICESVWGVTIVRFWEPSPFTGCQPEQDLVPKLREGKPTLASAGKALRSICEVGPERVLGVSEVVDLTEIGQDVTDFPLYLDEVHATPAFNRLIAENIAERLSERRTRKLLLSMSEQAEQKKTSDYEGGGSSTELYPLW